ncbi:MAG: hypothetical protein DRJ13_17010 [Bacteroidetes bacterium]|nr:MAG: hypothetical protein DRJ13_17010 [Bacteroidota bacterium]
MKTRFISVVLSLVFTLNLLEAQVIQEPDTIQPMVITTGWADEAVTIGYVAAPSAVTLMFVASLVPEWNAGYVAIPAGILILAAPPVIYAGGRSVNILKDISHPRAKLGWILYALSVVPTSMSMYSYSSDWGSTVPLTIASAVFGTASIVAMTSYAFSRAKTAREMQEDGQSALGFGIAPLSGGAVATITYRF